MLSIKNESFKELACLQQRKNRTDALVKQRQQKAACHGKRQRNQRAHHCVAAKYGDQVGIHTGVASRDLLMKLRVYAAPFDEDCEYWLARLDTQ